MLDEILEEVFSAAPEIELMAVLLPESPNVRRRVRVALHLLLERAGDLAQFVGELDELAIFMGGHGDPDGARVLLSFSDRIREWSDR